MSYAYPGLFCVFTLFRWVPVALSARSEDFKGASVKAGVIAIAIHFSELPTIGKLEEHGLSLEDSTNLVENLLQELKSIPPGMKPIYEDMLQGVLDANTGRAELLKMRNLLRGEAAGGDQVPPADDILAFKFAPIVSCEVERTFSQYGTVLRDNRQSLLFENLKRYLIVFCNQDRS